MRTLLRPLYAKGKASVRPQCEVQVDYIRHVLYVGGSPAALQKAEYISSAIDKCNTSGFQLL